MALTQQERKIRKREGNPNGTYFVVAVLMALLLAVGVYFVTVQTKEIATSQILEQDDTAPQVTSDSVKD